MSEFAGLWKHQNKPVCTKSGKSLQNVEVGHYTEVGGISKVNNNNKTLIIYLHSFSGFQDCKYCFGRTDMAAQRSKAERREIFPTCFSVGRDIQRVAPTAL